METDGLIGRIAELLHEVDEKLARVTPAEIRGKHVTQDLGLDSLDVIKFVLLVEEKFGLKLEDAEIDGRELLKVDNLARYLAERGAS